MAAAAITPAWLDSAFMCFTFPADKLNFFSFDATDLGLLIMTRNAAEVRLSPAYIAQNLRFQLLWTFELSLIPQAAQKLHTDALRRAALQGLEQKRLDGEVGSTECRPIPDVSH